MPWIQARLRQTLVFARCDERGAIGSGAVEIRYKLGDARAYRAQARNLKLVPGSEMLADAAFPEPQFAEPKATSKPQRGTDKAAASARAQSHSEHAFVAYTDGACSGNPGPAGSGVLLRAPGGAEAGELSEYLGTATNNIAELTAILRAAEAVPNDQPLIIHTDSQYAIGVLSKGWKAKANQELIAELRERLAARSPRAELVYVPGHAGVEGNERADQLARAAIARRSSQSTLPRE